MQWKCACTLSRSQSIIQRTNNNSTSYYTITYMAELDADDRPQTAAAQSPNPGPAKRTNVAAVVAAATARSSGGGGSVAGELRRGQQQPDLSPVRIYINS